MISDIKNSLIAAVLVTLLGSSCSRVQDSVSQYALKAMEGTTNEIYAVLYELAPELSSENLEIQEYGMTKWTGRDSTWAMILFRDDPEFNTRFVRLRYSIAESGKPEALQFTKGTVRFSWTPKNESGCSFQRMELLNEEPYRATPP